MATKSKSTSRTTSHKKKPAAAKRELIDTKRDKRFVRRDPKGKFNKSDDVGKSLTKDRRRAAKRSVKAGQGDKGDRKRRG